MSDQDKWLFIQFIQLVCHVDTLLSLFSQKCVTGVLEQLTMHWFLQAKLFTVIFMQPSLNNVQVHEKLAILT